MLSGDIRMVRELGFPGLVTGVLDVDGQVDIPRMQESLWLRPAAGGDLSSRVRSGAPRPASGLETLGELGVKRIPDFRSAILGGERYFINYGTYCRRGYSNHYGRCGSRAANLPLFLQAGVKEVHSSARQWLPSEMRFASTGGVSMSANPDADQYRTLRREWRSGWRR